LHDIPKYLEVHGHIPTRGDGQQDLPWWAGIIDRIKSEAKVKDSLEIKREDKEEGASCMSEDCLDVGRWPCYILLYI
jgi:hypothetical protein